VAAQLTVRLVRVVQAPRPRVFEAMIEPEQVAGGVSRRAKRDSPHVNQQRRASALRPEPGSRQRSRNEQRASAILADDLSRRRRFLAALLAVPTRASQHGQVLAG
jgi:hypothetical protein